MANAFVFSNWVAMEALRILENALEVAYHFDTKWMRQFEQQFAVGSSVQVKLPQRWTVRTGLGYQPQPINRLTTTVNCNLIKGIDFEWDSVEKALQMERSEKEISEQYLRPAMVQLAQQVDSDAADFARLNANNIVGQLGVDPTNSTTFMQGLQRLTELACPPGGNKGAIVTPSVATAVVPNIQTYFNPAPEISRAFKEGSLGMFNGFEWHNSMSLKRQTAGTMGTAGAVTISANVASGSNTITLTGNVNETLNVGDVISIANRNYVNPSTREAPNVVAKQFVVMQPVTFTGNPGDVVVVSPTIYGPGSQYQNVDSLPLTGDAITLFPGTSSPQGKSGAQNLLIHPDAFSIVSVKLESPEAVEIISQKTSPRTGIKIRFVRAFDAVQSRMINRWDLVYGFGGMYPDNCCVRMQGS